MGKRVSMDGKLLRGNTKGKENSSYTNLAELLPKSASVKTLFAAKDVD
jgi:hypothetical protein